MDLTQPRSRHRTRGLLLWIGAVLACAFTLPLVLDAYAQSAEPYDGAHRSSAFTPAIMLCGNVYNDVNRSNAIDAGDQGVALVLLSVLDTHGQLVISTTTDSNGRYCAGVQDVGAYAIQKSNPNGYVSINAFAGANGHRVNADQVQVPANQAGTYDANNFLIAAAAMAANTATSLPSATSVRAPAQQTLTPTPTQTATRTATPTGTITGTATSTATPTATHEAYPHPTAVPTDTAGPTATPTATRTATFTPTPTPTGARVVPSSGGEFAEQSLVMAYWVGVLGLILIGVARYLHKGSLD